MDNGGELIIQTPRGEDKKIILKKSRFLYGEDTHVRAGFSIKELYSMLENSGFDIRYCQTDFTFISQLIYETLEVVRRKSQIAYSVIWPLFYPFCLIDILRIRMRASNGIYLVAVKK